MRFINSEETISYEAWQFVKPSIPARSYFYQLDPVGIGKPRVESLTSFISRLAEAHCVPPGLLMTKVLTPIIGKEHGATLNKIYSFTCALNGTGRMAADLVTALQSITLHTELHLLTMLPWAKLLPNRHLLRSHRAWCPICYEEWYLKDQAIYEPLLWSLEAVKICSVHQQKLNQHCPYCHDLNYSLAWRSRPGHCSRCQNWLGSLSISHLSLPEAIPAEELAQQIWTANVIGELIEHTSFLTFSPTKDKLAKIFRTHVNYLTNGNLAEFARYLKIPKNTLWLWCQGKNQPSLVKLLEVCYRLQTSLLSLLTEEIVLEKSTFTKFIPLKQQVYSRADAKSLDLIQIKLYLEQVINSDEQPYPSLEEVARKLGRDRRTIVRFLPELSRAIAARYINQRKERKEKAISQCCKEVKQATQELYSKGIYPTEARISKILTHPGYLRYKTVRDVFKKARLKLGIKT